MKRTDLIRHLLAHGCLLHREGAAHTLYRNPANGKTAAVPRHREINPITTRTICRQLEIPAP